MKIVLASILLSSIAALVVVPGLAFAQTDDTPIENPGTLEGSINMVKTIIAGNDGGIASTENIFETLVEIIKWLLALSAVLAMGALVWGGIMYIMSLGDEGRAGKAKQIILYAIIGVVVVLLSFVIISFLQNILTNAPTLKSSYRLPFVAIAEADSDVSKGFNTGKDILEDNVATDESGLAQDNDIIPIIVNVVNLLLSLVAVIALAALVWGSIMYIMSLGDEGRVGKAKQIILYAIIGVLLSGLSFLILQVVQRLITGEA